MPLLPWATRSSVGFTGSLLMIWMVGVPGEASGVRAVFDGEVDLGAWGDRQRGGRGRQHLNRPSRKPAVTLRIIRSRLPTLYTCTVQVSRPVAGHTELQVVLEVDRDRRTVEPVQSREQGLALGGSPARAGVPARSGGISGDSEQAVVGCSGLGDDIAEHA